MRAMRAVGRARGTGVLTMALVGALVVALAGCERQPRPAGGDSLAVGSSPPVDSAPPVSWRLEPPATWDDRVRIVDEPDGAVRLRADGILSARLFEYLPRDSSIVPQTLLGIYAYDSTAWAKLSAEEGPPQGELLLQEEGVAFVAGLPQSNPFAPGSADSVEFDRRSVTLEYLRRAFHVVR